MKTEDWNEFLIKLCWSHYTTRLDRRVELVSLHWTAEESTQTRLFTEPSLCVLGWSDGQKLVSRVTVRTRRGVSWFHVLVFFLSYRSRLQWWAVMSDKLNINHHSERTHVTVKSTDQSLPTGLDYNCFQYWVADRCLTCAMVRCVLLAVSLLSAVTRTQWSAWTDWSPCPACSSSPGGESSRSRYRDQSRLAAH